MTGRFYERYMFVCGSITTTENSAKLDAKQTGLGRLRCRSKLLAVCLSVTLVFALVACRPNRDPKVTVDPAPDVKETRGDEIYAPDFTLQDQNGVQHTLSGYRGKLVFLTFWATWCSPCLEEFPDINQLYLDHEENTADIAVLSVIYPAKAGDTAPAGQEEKTIEEIRAFLSENGYRLPTLMDTNGRVFVAYKIDSLPTTYLIDQTGEVIGYVPAALSRELMDALIERALNPESAVQETDTSS
ncbi:MAG: TlpA family protein disulfide reductase [Clostridiaceae bacterium]|jgi:thiol-disulfide isomerase/thioredoxin|nr:TlpA family protein disulfide reductase [Clostridiaceae bacterium]